MLKPLRSHGAQAIVAALAEQVRQIEGPRTLGHEILSSGFAALDRSLPEGGFRRGSLVEWLSPRASGAGLLALLAAREAAREGGALVVVDPHGRFYPPAARSLGIELSRLIVLRPGEEDRAWAIDQALRSPAVAAVWYAVDDELSDSAQADHTLRRWQLAAEASGVLGLLLRSSDARQAPSWADLRLLVEPVAGSTQPAVGRDRRLRVELLRARAAPAGATIELEIPATQERLPRLGEEHETRRLHLAPSLAPAKTRRRSRRA